MNNGENDGVTSKAVTDATNALRLGWLMGEINGLLRHGAIRHQSVEARLRPGDSSPRLTVSDRDWNQNRSHLLRADLHLFHKLALALDVWPDASQSEVPALLHEYDQLLWQRRRRDVPDEVRLYRAFEGWSVAAHGTLLARNEAAARAFIYGASMVDTYWFMRPPPARGDDKRRPQERWVRLLQPDRLKAQSTRVGELERDLEPYLAAALKYSLRQWGVADKLEQTQSGKNEQVPPGREKRLMANLEKQTYIWRDLILGIRSPESYLRGYDRWLIPLLQLGSFLLLLGLIVGIVYGTIWFVSLTLTQLFLPGLVAYATKSQSFLEGALEPGDVIAAIPILFGLAGAFWKLGSWGAEQLIQVFRSVGRSVRAWRIQRCTHIQWDRGL